MKPETSNIPIGSASLFPQRVGADFSLLPLVFTSIPEHLAAVCLQTEGGVTTAPLALLIAISHQILTNLLPGAGTLKGHFL